MNSVTDFTRKVTDSTADFVESVMYGQTITPL